MGYIRRQGKITRHNIVDPLTMEVYEDHPITESKAVIVNSENDLRLDQYLLNIEDQLIINPPYKVELVDDDTITL